MARTSSSTISSTLVIVISGFVGGSFRSRGASAIWATEREAVDRGGSRLDERGGCRIKRAAGRGHVVDQEDAAIPETLDESSLGEREGLRNVCSAVSVIEMRLRLGRAYSLHRN